MRRAWIVVVVTAFSTACSGGTDPMGEPCTNDGECPDGLCVDGFCQTNPDAGDRDSGRIVMFDAGDGTFDAGDGTFDAGSDAGAAMDASTSIDAGFDPFGDVDGDGISDLHEGRTASGGVDTDGDGAPDYLDPDSDGDGILDSVEAGDMMVTTAPVDSDFDGTPDFRDLDSDDNGIPDMVEGISDVDGDSRPAFRDFDNDEDGLDDRMEIGGDPMSPRDTDGDGTPDYNSPDSDGDTIGDLIEGLIDTDGDGTPDIFDLDTDGDGFTDAEEAGDTDVRTPPVDTDLDGTPDFRDPDSDADGLSDASERAAGTSPTRGDTDGDGVSDLIEVGAGTDPLNPADNPRARGDFVFIVPYMLPPDPTRDTLQFDTSLRDADVYFLMDNTGSMGGTIAALQGGLTSTVIPDIRASIPNAWFGVGGFDDYPISPYGQNNRRTDALRIVHDAAFFQLQTMTASTGLAQTAVNYYGTNYGRDGPESAVPALYALASRNNLAGYARFSGNSSTPPACPAGYTGMACFRPSAVPIIVVMTDTNQHNAPTCISGGCPYVGVPGAPSWAQTTSALGAINARVVGIDTSGGATSFLTRLIQDTTIARGAPGPASSYVLSAPGGSGLTSAVTSAVRRAAEVPLDVSASAADLVDPGETTDAVAEFLDHLVTRTTAAPGLTCTTGLSTYDRAGIDADTFPDTFRSVSPSNPVCFDIIPKMNVTVPATLDPQLFRAQINVLGDGFTPLDSRIIFFLVPPRIPAPNE